jgi:hypothetical protein
MLIRRATITDYACLTGTTDVEFGPGLNVIHGPNEAGKTTLLRAIRSALTIKSNVTGSFHREMRSRSGGHPEVELVFEHDDATFALRKRFQGQSGSTTLQITSSSGSIEELAGDEAESRLREVLGVDETKRQVRGSAHLGVWPLLWIEQGQSGDVPTDHLTDGARDALDRRLSELSGEVLAGAGGGQLLDLAKSEYERFYTASGQESGRADSPIKQARSRLEAAETVLNALEEKEHQHTEAVDDYSRVTSSLVEIDKQLPDLRLRAEEAQRAVELAESMQRDHGRLCGEMESCSAQRDAIRERVDARQTLRADLQELRESLSQADKEVRDALALEEEHAAEREALAQAVTDAESRGKEGERLLRRTGAHVELLRLRETHANLTDRVKKAKDLRAKIIEADGKLENESLTPAVVKKLEKLERASREAQLAMEAAAATVEVGAITDIEIVRDGKTETISAGQTIRQSAVDPTEIRVPQHVTVRVTPGGDELAERRRAVQSAEQKLAKAYQTAGVQSADEAVERLATKQQIASDRKSHAQFLDIHAPEGLDALEAQAETTKHQIGTFETALRESTIASDDALPEDIEVARTVSADVERAAVTSRQAINDARQKLAAHDAKHQELQGNRRGRRTS